MTWRQTRKSKPKRTGIKRDALDEVVSNLVREMAEWTCLRCHAYFQPGLARLGLHNSHYFGRQFISTRYDLENCDSLCYGCHHHWEQVDRDAYRAYMVRKLGQDGYDRLVLRAHHPLHLTQFERNMLRQQYEYDLLWLQRLRMQGLHGPVTTGFLLKRSAI